MDELIKLVSQKAGIPEEAAKNAVTTVVDFLKQKLPAPIASQIDSVLANPNIASQAGNIAKGIGGLLGKK